MVGSNSFGSQIVKGLQRNRSGRTPIYSICSPILVLLESFHIFSIWNPLNQSLISSNPNTIEVYFFHKIRRNPSISTTFPSISTTFPSISTTFPSISTTLGKDEHRYLDGHGSGIWFYMGGGRTALVAQVGGGLKVAHVSMSTKVVSFQREMDVSNNRGTPKWMVYKGKPY